jgi:hypothetical protein
MPAGLRHLIVCLGVTAAAWAPAHSLMPAADWCENGKVEAIGEFDFPGASLERIDARFGRLFEGDGDYCSAGRPRPLLPSANAHAGGAPGLNSCGVVDNHWNKAARMAWDYCAGLDPASDVIPIVTFPADYYDEGHHQHYQLGQGLRGRCVRCADKAP